MFPWGSCSKVFDLKLDKSKTEEKIPKSVDLCRTLSEISVSSWGQVYSKRIRVAKISFIDFASQFSSAQTWWFARSRMLMCRELVYLLMHICIRAYRMCIFVYVWRVSIQNMYVCFYSVWLYSYYFGVQKSCVFVVWSRVCHYLVPFTNEWNMKYYKCLLLMADLVCKISPINMK